MFGSFNLDQLSGDIGNAWNLEIMRSATYKHDLTLGPHN